jgi:hypothetical protein
VYDNNLKKPHPAALGRLPLRRVNSIDVEEWLKTLKMAPATRSKIRNVMRMVYRHAIRWGMAGAARESYCPGSGWRLEAEADTSHPHGYTHARMETKRVAQSKVVDILFDRKPQPELEATA